MKKATFLEYDKPRLCAMVQDSNPDDMICTICNSLYDGAEAFGIQLENLEHQYRTEENLKRIFSFCRGLPIYITSYRNANNTGFTDEQCAELLLLGVKCGATIADIMGDMFCREEHELTMDAEAIKKQKALADKIHSLGGEVLFSSHLHGFYDEEECMRIAREQKARGADVVKIVNFSSDGFQLTLDEVDLIAFLAVDVDLIVAHALMPAQQFPPSKADLRLSRMLYVPRGAGLQTQLVEGATETRFS